MLLGVYIEHTEVNYIVHEEMSLVIQLLEGEEGICAYMIEEATSSVVLASS
jgi:hypothetical protein